MKKIAEKILVVFAIFLFAINTASAKSFTDLNEDHWAYNEITELANEDIVWGYPNDEFRPDQPVTRAEFATMVIKALWQEKYDPLKIYYYKDVPKSHWAYLMIQRASEFGLLKSFPNFMFEPDRAIKKGEAISIVISAVNAGEITELKARSILKNYQDVYNIPKKEIIAAGKAEQFSLIVNEPGKPKIFNADNAISRAEIAVTLHRMRKQALLHPNSKLAGVLTPKTAQGETLDGVYMEPNGIIAVIPTGTIIEGILADEALCSQKAKEGKIFAVKTTQNYVTKQNYLLFPANTNVIGEIIKVKKARYFIRNGKMDLESTKLITDDGHTGGFHGLVYNKPNQPGFFSRIFRAIFKGKKLVIKEEEVLCVKTTKPIRINVANTTILSD